MQARRIRPADNLRTAVGLRPLLLGSDVSEVQRAAGTRNMEEPAVCFLEELADGHTVRMQPGDDFNVLSVAKGEVLEHPVASENTLQTFSVCTNEVNKHLATSESISQTLPVSADEDQQHPVASKSIPRASPVSRGQSEAVSVVEDVQALEVGYMKDELAIDGNEEVLFKPLAGHSRLLQQASDKHSRQREALCDMVGAESRFRESLQRELHHPFGRVKTASAELNAAIEAAFQELAKDDRIMPKAAAWNLQILQYAVEDEADSEMASTISTTRSSTALSSSSSTAATDGFPSRPCSAISSTGSMTVNTWATSPALDGVTFH